MRENIHIAMSILLIWKLFWSQEMDDVGHVSYYNGKFEAYQRTYILHSFKDLILTRFLHLFLDGYLKATVSKQKLGNTMPYIKMGMLTDFKIPVPPLSEQECIVKILDEAFEKIEKAKENAEKNLKNSKELFESYLQSIFTNPGKDWEEKTINDACEIVSTLIDPKKKDFNNLYHIGAGNMISNSEVLINLKTAKEEKLISGKFLFDTTMILYSKIRPYLMKVARPDFSGLCSADIYPLKPKDKIMTRDFLFIFCYQKNLQIMQLKVLRVLECLK